MTFIATVIAKDGLAVIADSLVSTRENQLSVGDWMAFINKKRAEANGQEYSISEEEIVKLFHPVTKSTKNYEHKLFEYDKFTAITTAGSAHINNKRIRKIISEIRQVTQKLKRSYTRQGITRKVEEFVDQLHVHLTQHFEQLSSISETTFIISNYDPKTSASRVFKIEILRASKVDYESDPSKFIKMTEGEDKIMYDGQYKVVDRILFGSIFHLFRISPLLIDLMKTKLIEDGIVEENAIPHDCFNFIRNINHEKVKPLYSDALQEIELFKLSDLSLQEAADLAYTLLKVERDFQNYTKEIPTVGGNVKLAIISDDGFQFILGNGVVNPITH